MTVREGSGNNLHTSRDRNPTWTWPTTTLGNPPTHNGTLTERIWTAHHTSHLYKWYSLPTFIGTIKCNPAMPRDYTRSHCLFLSRTNYYIPTSPQSTGPRVAKHTLTSTRGPTPKLFNYPDTFSPSSGTWVSQPHMSCGTNIWDTQASGQWEQCTFIWTTFQN